MLYGGALASGALAGRVALSGHHFAPGLARLPRRRGRAGSLGNLLGACVGWLIGVVGGHPLLERYGRYVHVTPERIARAERWFERFEGVAVPLGFATPLVRSFVAIPAGMFEVRLRALRPLRRGRASRPSPSRSPGSAGRSVRAGTPPATTSTTSRSRSRWSRSSSSGRSCAVVRSRRRSIKMAR